MYKLIYFILPLLFLNFNFKNSKKSMQIFRYLVGFIYTFIVFYLLNMDKSLSAVLVNLKFIVIFQAILTILDNAVYKEIYKEKKSNIKNFPIILTLIFIVSLGYSFSPYIYGGAKKLAKMTETKESDHQSPKIDTENIIIIPPETAYYQMQTLIGSLPNPSLYKIGQISLTKTSKGAYYVAPIDIEGSFKAFLNKELPGVAYVSAERLEDAKLINVPHKLGESLVFNHNIYRKMRSYKPSFILLNADIELDDDMNAFYVGSYGHYKYGRKGIIVDGVILYNLKTGDIKEYAKNDTPKWVDQIYTTDVAVTYNKYFGKLQKGWLNSKIGQKGVHIPTEWSADIQLKGFNIESKQVVPVIGNNDEFYYFTDHTNTSNTSTTMTGYTLLNTRTGEMIYYKTPGFLNGQGAMNSVEKLLGAEKNNWTTAQPILYNLYGIDTWIVPVINKTDGSFVKIGLVTAQSKYSILAENKVNLLDQFKKAIADGKVFQGADVKVNNSAKLNEEKVSGKILRINQTTEDGQPIFYIKLDTVNDKIFMISKNVNAEVVLAKEGDNVNIKYINADEQKIQSVTSIDITFQK